MKAFLFLAVFLMASCASVPMQESYLLSVEKRMQASEHWKVLGKEIAAEVQGSIEKQSNEQKQNHHASAVYISDVDQSSFGRAMYTVLTTEFVKHNVAISQDANARFRLDWSVQPVVHKAERKDSPSLVYIIFVGIPQAVFLGEADFGFRSKPHTEVIVTFRLKNNDIDSYRQTHIYAINDADIDHYWEISEQGMVSTSSKTAPHIPLNE
ncbi:MAG: hypothetical protein HY895_18830 [Deltaproteobacteria bacterium]|nr:hypothetical protein [Deltaproteobacteria bacterium]